MTDSEKLAALAELAADMEQEAADLREKHERGIIKDRHGEVWLEEGAWMAWVMLRSNARRIRQILNPPAADN